MLHYYEEDSHTALITLDKTQMPVLATLALTTGEGPRDAVLRGATVEGPPNACVTAGCFCIRTAQRRGISREGPRDAA